MPASADGELGQGDTCAFLPVLLEYTQQKQGYFFFSPLVFLHMCCRLTGGCVTMCLFLSTQRNVNICPHVHCVIGDPLNRLNSWLCQVVSRGCTAAFRSVAKWLKQGHVANLLHRWWLVFFNLGFFRGKVRLFMEFHLSSTKGCL